jgi:phospholipid/cholesterol/gamma-HCH transport system permease protein
MVEIGWRSAPIIFLTSLFTGMVLALQIGSVTTNLFNEPACRHYNRVFFDYGISSRSYGNSCDRENRGCYYGRLGTMKVKQNSLTFYTYTLAADPVKSLAVSRFLACLFMLPILTIIANIIGIHGGMFITTNL